MIGYEDLASEYLTKTNETKGQPESDFYGEVAAEMLSLVKLVK